MYCSPTSARAVRLLLAGFVLVLPCAAAAQQDSPYVTQDEFRLIYFLISDLQYTALDALDGTVMLEATVLSELADVMEQWRGYRERYDRAVAGAQTAALTRVEIAPFLALVRRARSSVNDAYEPVFFAEDASPPPSSPTLADATPAAPEVPPIGAAPAPPVPVTASSGASAPPTVEPQTNGTVENSSRAPEPADEAETPATTAVRAGTQLTLRLDGFIGSKEAEKGDTFDAVLAEDVTYRGRELLFPAGTYFVGHVENVTRAGAFGRSGKLKLVIDHVEGPDGRRASTFGEVVGLGDGEDIEGRSSSRSGRSGLDSAVSSITAGGMLGGKKGALVGAAVATVSTAGELVGSGGEDVFLKRGTVILVELTRNTVLDWQWER